MIFENFQQSHLFKIKISAVDFFRCPCVSFIGTHTSESQKNGKIFDNCQICYLRLGGMCSCEFHTRAAIETNTIDFLSVGFV